MEYSVCTGGHLLRATEYSVCTGCTGENQLRIVCVSVLPVKQKIVVGKSSAQLRNVCI